MSELKLLPCPFCGGEPELHNNSSETLYGVYCPACGAQTAHEGFTAGDDAIAAWNRRAQPDQLPAATKLMPNVPLTLEALRGMNGEPVWVTHSDGSGGRWGIVNSYNHGLCADVGSGMAYWFDDHIGNVAYRRKLEPEGGDHNA